VIVVGALTAVAGFAAPAFAGNPDCTGHCYSIALSPSSMSGSPWQGARATMYLAYMAAGGGTTAHINSTLWVVQNTDPYNIASIEDGIYDGWIEPDGYSSCTGFLAVTCVHWGYDSASGASSNCIHNGCGGYVIYWADIRNSGGTENIYFHIVKFTSPSPGTQLYVDIGYNSPNWILHIMSSGIGLDYYGTSTINSDYHYAAQVEVGGELQQGPNANACANTNFMTFAVWAPRSTYQPWDAEVSNGTAYVSRGFNGTHLVPGTNAGTWLWNLPTSANPNGC